MKIVPFILLLLLTKSGCSADSNSPSERTTNVDYLKNTLGPIILNNRSANGEVPDSFDAAHTASGVTLPNRGDYYGHSLAYKKLGPDSLQFHSYGSNGTDDGGGNDDIVMTHTNGARTP